MQITSTQNKVLAGLLALAMVLTLVAGFTVSFANAQTTSFARNLTVGSRGTDVVALQTMLVNAGHLVMPAGVAMGYFGPLTRAAVAKWQLSAGISPAAGYFGPISRAYVNNGTVPPVVGGGGTCPAGYTCTPVGGVPGVITTPGAEGTLTVTKLGEPASGTTVREGESMKSVLGLKIDAKNSDIQIQRVKVQVGTTTTYYTKVFKKIYITDASGNVLASSDLNSDTVTKDGSNYFVTLAGVNKVVKKGTAENLYVKVDLHSSINTTDRWARTLVVPANGVRGIDGAGIDQYSPASAFSDQTVSIAGSIVDSASLTITRDEPTTAPAAELIANEDRDGEGSSAADDKDKVSLLSVKLAAQDDNVKITDWWVRVDMTGTGTATTSVNAYLYDGTTLVGSAALSASTPSGRWAKISDLSYVVPAGTTKVLTVKADVRNSNGSSAVFTAYASSTGITAENSQGGTVSPSGSATGNSVSVRNVGPEITLAGTPTFTKTTETSSGISTSTATVTYNLKVKAVNGDIILGTTGSTTGAMVNNDVTHLHLFRNGSAAAQAGVSTSTSITVPSGLTVTSNSFTLTKDTEVTIPVTMTFKSKTNAGVDASTLGLYSVQLQAVSWVGPAGVASTTFMNGLSAWRTPEISFP